jgi:hypothetical protein
LPRAAGVVDENVEFAEPFADERNERKNGCFIRHVAFNGLGLRADLRRDFLRLLCVDVGDEHVRPFFGKPFRRCAPDAAGAAGDDCDFIFKSHEATASARRTASTLPTAKTSATQASNAALPTAQKTGA